MALLPQLLSLLGVVVRLAQAAPPLQLHVHPTKGDDSNTGALEAPLRTIVAARDAIRAARHDASLAAEGATVLLHGGTHAPFALDPKLDSGTAHFPIRYAAASDADPPLISAGMEVPKSAWKPAGADMPSGVLMADLNALGLRDFGSLPHSGGQIDACDQCAPTTAASTAKACCSW